jgi:hypothetical protein
MSYLRLLSRQWYRCPPKVCLWRGVSSEYWAVYKFFASQSLHNRNFFKKKSGEAKDSAIFPFFILLHKRAKPIPQVRPSCKIRPPLETPKSEDFLKECTTFSSPSRAHVTNY